jgi:hypothetical protein
VAKALTTKFVEAVKPPILKSDLNCRTLPLLAST